MISVVVCTFNRAAALTRFLEQLTTLTTPVNGRWELVVVDNNSTDGTREVIERFRTRLPVPLVYHFEPRQGLAFARNAGVARSRFDLVAFTDDDCLVTSNWLVRIEHEFQWDPTLGVLTGRVEAVEGLPEDVSTRRETTRAEVTTLADIRRYTIGCNMVFRRSVLESVGPFDTCLGAGTPCRAGEDSDFVYRALRKGHRVVYSPELLIAHAHDRVDSHAILKLQRGYLKGRGAFYCKHVLSLDLNIARHLYWELKGLFVRHATATPGVPRLSRREVFLGLVHGAVLWMSCTLLQTLRR